MSAGRSEVSRPSGGQQGAGQQSASPSHKQPARTHPMRVLMVLFCILGIGALFGSVVRQSAQENSADQTVIAHERAGVVYLHPLTALIGALVQAQSTAVGGEPVDAEVVDRALKGLGTAEAKVGALLGTTQRFNDLRTKIDTALANPVTAKASFDLYTGLLTLANALQRQVGDSSNLIHDADLDSFYLMDAAVIRLPLAMVYDGKTLDLVNLAGGRNLAGEDAVKAAVARYGVADAGEQVSAGLAKSVDVTDRASLGTNIAQQLDAFRSAVDAFAPPTMLNNLATGMDAVLLGPAARQVFATALPLAHRLLAELDAVLASRQAQRTGQWQVTVWSSVAAGVVAVLLLWLVARAPALRRGSPFDLEPEAESEGVGSLTDARSLLDSGELVHVGRAVWGRPRGRGDAQ
jgi:hypothetical protein